MAMQESTVAPTALSGELLVVMYRRMCEIRIFEERLGELYARGQIPGFIHLSIGQEAAAVGMGLALRPDDYMTTHHRPHGHIIAKGGQMGRLMAELMGKRTGYNGGKGGHMHVTATDIGLLKTVGIVGSHLPLTVGAALSSQLRGSGQVAVCMMGEGAANQGTFHESLNLAAVWKLPAVFFVENNQYASSVSTSHAFTISDVAVRAQAYNIPGVIVDGNDVVAVYQAATTAVERARSGGGPTLLEAKTYRTRGHHEGDPSKGFAYRTREEVQAWQARDPIPRLAGRLSAEGVLSADEAAAIDAEARQAVEAAIQFAFDSPLPDAHEAVQGLYTQPFPLAGQSNPVEA
jgi:TPP-dependent pyruvate/acetoin dehydrogenase alpha subunit